MANAEPDTAETAPPFRGRDLVVREPPANRTAQPALRPILEYQASGTSTALYMPPMSQGVVMEALLELKHHMQSWPEAEPFEDGMENYVSRGIEHLIAKYNRAGIDALSEAYADDALSSAVLSEALLTLGQIDDHSTQDARFSLLVHCLRDKRPSIRSTAADGLVSLEDPRATPLLRKAALEEEVNLLRSHLSDLAAYLVDN